MADVRLASYADLQNEILDRENADKDISDKVEALSEGSSREIAELKSRADSMDEAISEMVADEVFDSGITVTKAAGGIAVGTDLSGKSLKSVLKDMLCPYVAPKVSVGTLTYAHTSTDYSIVNKIVEHGDRVNVTKVILTVTKGSENIASVTVSHGSNSGSNTSLSAINSKAVGGSATVTVSISTSFTTANDKITASVNDGNAGASATGGAFTFVYPYYSGCVGADAAVNAADVKSLTKSVKAKENQTITFDPDNQYMIFASPYAVKKISDGSLDYTSAFNMTEMNITGLDGTAQRYYVYKFANTARGTYTYIFEF